MLYSDIRPTIKSGDVLAWSEGNWKSMRGIELNIVKMATMPQYSHVGIAWVVGGRVFVVEAILPCSRIYPLSKLLPFYLVQIPNTMWDSKVEEYALEAVEKTEAEWGSIKGFLDKTNKEGKWQCAELVQEVLAHSDLSILGIKATPDNIVDYCVTRYKSQVIKVN